MTGSFHTLDGGLTQGQLREELSTFKSQVDQRFDNLEERIQKEGQALAFAFNQRFDKIDQRFDKIEKRLDQIDKRLDQIDKRLDVIESFQASFQQKLA